MPFANLDNALSGAGTALAIRADFDTTYQNTYKGLEQYLGNVMQLAVPSDKRSETFAMIESMPTPELWHRGDPIPTEGTGSKRFSITNYTYGKRISWHLEDRQDSQLGDILPRFRALSERMALVTSKAFIEIITGTASLLPAIPTAPDGVALFYATDGESADRFGVSGGNIITGGGVTSQQLIDADFFNAAIRFGQFQDTKGEPYYEPGIQGERYTVIAGIANMRLFMAAFKAQLIHSVIAGSSTTDVQTGAATDNLVLASGANVDLRFTSRITDNDWFVFRNDAPVKPIFETDRSPIMEESALADGNNSDEVRNTHMEYVQYSLRKGFGVNVPFGVIKVNN